VRWDRGGGGGLSLAVQLSAGMAIVVADKNMKLQFAKFDQMVAAK